jgi:hypothetical protein
MPISTQSHIDSARRYLTKRKGYREEVLLPGGVWKFTQYVYEHTERDGQHIYIYYEALLDDGPLWRIERWPASTNVVRYDPRKVASGNTFAELVVSIEKQRKVKKRETLP